MKRGLVILIVAIVLVGVIVFYMGSLQGQSGSSYLPTSSGNCNFEKRHQQILIFFKNQDRSGGFVAPSNIGYSEVKFKGFGVVANLPRSDASFFLNGVQCGFLPKREEGFTNTLYDLTDSCLSELKEGINSFSTISADPNIDSALDTRSIIEIEVEMELRPANCLR